MSAPETVPTPAPAQTAPEPFESMHDLRCPVTVILGTGSVTVRQCLELKRNSIVVLRQGVGEDLELRINGVLIAQGEGVIVEDTTSIRVTSVDVSNEPGG